MEANLSNLFIDDKDFNKEIIRVSKYMEKIKRYKKKVLLSSKNLYEVLLIDETISKDLEKLYVYSKFKSDLNVINTKQNNNFIKVRSLYVKYSQIASFVIPEIIEKEYKIIKSYLIENKNLKKYENNIKFIYSNKKHKLSASEEYLISEITDTANNLSDALSKLTNIDLKFSNENLTINSYEKEISIADKTKRKSIFNETVEKLEAIKYTSSSLINGIISHNNKLSKLKKYKSSLEMFLEKNELDVSIYQTLLKGVTSNIKIFNKYWDLKKKMLNSKKINIYDVNTPISEEINKKYTINDARNYILGTSLLLGKEYSDEVNNLFINERIDCEQKENKKDIAYTTSSYEKGALVFLNYDESFRSMMTLSHEVGHAVHFNFSSKANNFSNYEPSIFITEIVSQVNELLLNKYLFQLSKNKKDKLYLLEENLKDFEFVMRKATMCAEYEKNIHDYNYKGNILSHEYLSQEYKNILDKYYNNNVVLNNGCELDYIRFSSMLGKYYVYQYATGYVCALVIADKIWNKESEFLDKYLEMLKHGKSMNPNKLLQNINIDINNVKIYKQAFSIFEKNLNAYENLYNSKEENINE